MSGTPLALLSLGVALRSATPLSATLEPVENWSPCVPIFTLASVFDRESSQRSYKLQSLETCDKTKFCQNIEYFSKMNSVNDKLQSFKTCDEQKFLRNLKYYLHSHRCPKFRVFVCVLVRHFVCHTSEFYHKKKHQITFQLYPLLPPRRS